MTAVFLKILNMSITGAVIAAAVLLLRPMLKRAPRALVCALWLLVGLRLLVPFTFESPMSLMPANDTVTESSDGSISVNTGIGFINSALSTPQTPPQSIILPEGFTPPTVIPDSGEPSNGTVTIPEAEEGNESEHSVSAVDIAAIVWASGTVLMVIYAAVSYLRIRLRVRESVKVEKGIFICDRIDSPFILGVIRPRIYMPSDTPEGDTPYIISHEKAHLKRLDHLWKPLGFLLLSLHWFNPVMWISYIMLCRDIELACDEKVIRAMGEEAKKPYSDALISASSPRRLISACPLAFGEVGVKKRIKAVLSYKKPTLWIIIAAVLALCIVAACFLTSRKADENEPPFCIEAQNSASDMDGVWAEITKTDTEEGKMTVVWHNDTDKELTFGEEFYIYRVEESGQTVDTYTLSEEYAWNLVGYPVVPGGTFEKEYDLTQHDVRKDSVHRYETYFHISGDNPVPHGLEKYAVIIDFATSESFIPKSTKPAESDTPDLPTPDVLSNLEKVEASDDVKCTITLSGYTEQVTVEGDVAKALYREVATSITDNEKHFNVPSEQSGVGLSFTVNGFENSYYFRVFDNDTVQTELPIHTTICKGYALKSGSYEKVKAMVEGHFDGTPSPEKLDLNQNLVADIGLTFEEMKAKHGDVVDYQVLNGGAHYKFEKGYGFYFFYNNPVAVNGGGDQEWVYKDDGTPWYHIPDEKCVCISIDNLKAKDIFSLEFEKLYEYEIKAIEGVTLSQSSTNKIDIFDSNTLTIRYSGFPTGMTTLSINYYDYITPESSATLGIHPLHWESFVSGNLPQFNEELLADIGLTFEKMKAKYGEVISFQNIDYGIHYTFEKGYGQYFFKGKDDTNNTKTAFTSDGTEYPIPSEDSVCLSIINITASDVLSGDFDNMQIYDVGNIKGVLIQSLLDTEVHDDNRFCATLSYEGLPSRYASIVLYYRDGIKPENRAKICVPMHLWDAYFDGVPTYSELLTSELMNSLEKVEAMDDLRCILNLPWYMTDIIISGSSAKELYREVLLGLGGSTAVLAPTEEQLNFLVAFTNDDGTFSEAYVFYDSDIVVTQALTLSHKSEAYSLKSGTFEKIKELAKALYTGVPAETHIGTWAQSKDQLHEALTVSSVSRDAVSFSVIVSNQHKSIFTLEATAHKKNGKYYFGEDVSTKFNAPDGVSGYLEFTTDGIIMTFDSLGVISEGLNFDKVYRYTEKVIEEVDHYYLHGTKEALPPSLTLVRASKQFTFNYSYLSSYLAHGTYELTDKTLTLRTSDGLYTYVFNVTPGDSLRFDSTKSSPLPKYKYSADAEKAEPPFGHGALFTKVLDSDDNTNDIPTSEISIENFVERGKNHTTDFIYNDERVQCGASTQVYSDDGKLLGEISSRTGCHVEYQTVDGENVVLVWAAYGTGLSNRQAVFYRTSDGKVSEEFNYYLDSANGLVVYGLLDGVMVRHIFDKDRYSKKFDTFEMPIPSDYLEPFVNAVISDDGKLIEITYRIKTDDGLPSTNTETFELE